VTRIDPRSIAASVRGSFSTSAISASAVSFVTVTHGIPSTTAFPKKISEKDWPMMARMPRRRIACGACSRDDPQPKLALTIISAAPA
jgi:hypothetical protein